jgi:hypothetical protein
VGFEDVEPVKVRVKLLLAVSLTTKYVASVEGFPAMTAFRVWVPSSKADRLYGWPLLQTVPGEAHVVAACTVGVGQALAAGTSARLNAAMAVNANAERTPNFFFMKGLQIAKVG